MSFLSRKKTAAEAAVTAADYRTDDVKTFVFEEFPMTLADLKKRPEADLKDPFGTAALTLVALCVYVEDKEAGGEMLNFLRGPAKLSNFDRKFLADRFAEYDYVPASFFEGAAPENDYTPDEPYKLTVSAGAHSFDTEGYMTLFIKSGGADSPRMIKLRNKPSTGEWFVWDYVGLLSGVKTPVSQNPWA